MSEKKIKSAWIDAEKHKLEVAYSYKEEGGKEVVIEGEKHDDFLHPDLIAAFGKLRIHYACACGYIKPDQIENIKTPDEEFVEMFRVNQFILGKDEDDPSVKLTGGIWVPWMDRDYIGSNSQHIRFEHAEGYRYKKELKKAIDRCSKEIQSYLDGSKRGEDPQQALPFGENGKVEEPAAA